MATTSAGSYSFASEPKPVAHRKKYRDDNVGLYSANLMFDKRVVRGNTYATTPINLTSLQAIAPHSHLPAQSHPSSTHTRSAQHTNKLGQTATRSYSVKGGSDSQSSPSSSSALHPARSSTSVQTEDYLEELTDEVFERAASSQTDMVDEEDVEVPPVYLPRPYGIDAATQVMYGELFDFDKEVETVLAVLIGKTVDQAVVEVAEEEEAKQLHNLRLKHQQIRNAVIAETQRLEAANKRVVMEKERRVAEERDRLRREKELLNKLNARSTARHVLSQLSESVLSDLVSQGHLMDPLKRSVEQDFMPWLMQQVSRKSMEFAVAQECTTMVIKSAVSRVVDEVKERERRVREAAAAELAKQQAAADQLNDALRKQKEEEEDQEKKRKEEEAVRMILDKAETEAEAQLQAQQQLDDEQDDDNDDENEEV